MNRRMVVPLGLAVAVAVGAWGPGVALGAPAAMASGRATVAQGSAPSPPPAPAAPPPATGPASAAGPALTLDGAIQEALTHNPQVVAAQQALVAAQQGVLVARTGLAPTVSVNGTGNVGTGSATTFSSQNIPIPLVSVQGTGTVSVVGTVPLFDGGRTAAAVAAAQAGVASAAASLKLTEASIELQTATAFLSVLNAEHQTAVREAQLTQAQAQQALTQAQVTAGVEAQSDVIQQQALVAQAEVNLLSAQAQIATSVAVLQALLGADVTASVEAQEPAAPPPAVAITAAAVLQAALANRPELAQAQAQVDAAQAGLALARVDAGPQISVGVNAAYTPVSTSNALSNSMTYGLGGTVSLPLFDGGKGQAEIQQAQATLQGAQASLSAAQLSVRQDAYTSYLNAVQAGANLTATQAAKAAADQALQVSQGRYRAGVTTILEVTTAEATAAQAEVNYVSAVYSYDTALATLQHAEGLPIHSATVGGTP